MSVGEHEDLTRYRAVVNQDEQYSVWPADREIPLGWRDAGKSGTKDEVIEWIREVWTDMRPIRLRRRIEEEERISPPVPPPAAPVTMAMLRVVEVTGPQGPIPEGLKFVPRVRWTPEPASAQRPVCPVLAVGGDHDLWPMSHTDGRPALAMVMYDPMWQPVAQMEKSGARSVERITLDGGPEGETATFWGPGSDRVVVTLHEIESLAGEPLVKGLLRVVELERPPGPVPDGLTFVPRSARSEASSIREELPCPVLAVGAHHKLWPLSYSDNRLSLGMVLYDSMSRPVAQVEKPGARYIERITLEGSEREGKVTFWGQGNDPVVMTLREIESLLRDGTP